jgi:hypothetical protein
MHLPSLRDRVAPGSKHRRFELLYELSKPFRHHSRDAGTRLGARCLDGPDGEFADDLLALAVKNSLILNEHQKRRQVQ